MRCPGYGSTAVETTLMGGLGVDKNRAWCHGCGWEGIAQDAMTREEVVEQVKAVLDRAVKPYLGETVSPTTELRQRLLEAVMPFVRRTEKFFPPDGIKAEVGDDPTTVVITLDKTHFEGWSAGELRAYNIPVQEQVPDCAVLKDGQWSWVEVDVVLKPSEDEA